MPERLPASVWEDRRAQVAGPGLHALVIGVSDYEFLPAPNQFPDPNRVTLGLTKVGIPATGAFRVARWLRDRYWHPTVKVKTIRLLMSPSAGERQPRPDAPADEVALAAGVAAAAGTQPRATTDQAWMALQDWQDECRGHPDDVAVLYAAGHGIQWASKDDAIVLMEDFSKDQNFLDWAIDVGRVLKGMGGADMPQTQLYFADPCRIHPDEYKKYPEAGRPKGFRAEFAPEDLRAAPLFFGACPQTAAMGRRGGGTYFAEALVDCLESLALQGPKTNSSLPVAGTHWHVGVSELIGPLQDRVAAVAARDKQKQPIMLGGQVRPAVFNATPAPPNVVLVVDVDPDQAAQVAFAELWSSTRAEQVRGRAACFPRPLRIDSVPAGVYLLELSAGSPFKPRGPIAVNALPPEWKQTIPLS